MNGSVVLEAVDCDPLLCVCVADQHILIGADEGIYTLNLNELHESSMELVSCQCSPPLSSVYIYVCKCVHFCFDCYLSVWLSSRIAQKVID